MHIMIRVCYCKEQTNSHRRAKANKETVNIDAACVGPISVQRFIMGFRGLDLNTFLKIVSLRGELVMFIRVFHRKLESRHLSRETS